MTASVKIEATFADGKPLEELQRLIQKRVQILGEMTDDAVRATAITVVQSLRSGTKKAPKAVDPRMFHVYRLGEVSGWNGPKGHRRRTIRAGEHGPVVHGVYPVNLMYGLKGVGGVWQIRLANQNVQWTKTRNKGRYVVMAPTFEVAMRYACARVRHLLDKERGMGHYALGMAQAKLSSRGNLATPKDGSANAFRIAAEAATIETSGSGVAAGTFGIRVTDDLRYSALALKGGPATVQTALMRAANSIAGRLRKAAGKGFEESLATPFPEVAGRRKR